MALLGTFTKQPGETLDYDIEGGDWLPRDDEIISVAAVADAGISIGSTSIIDSGRTVKVWIFGGTSGTTYKVQVTMTTDDGRIKENEFKIKVREV